MNNTILSGFKLNLVHSIYKNGFKLHEFVSNNKVESLLQNNMGIEFGEDNFHRKTHGCANEQEHLTRYFKTYIASKGYFNNTVKLPQHNWGRIKSENHCTLSVMYRPTRHSLCQGTYVDIDIVSCCQNIFTNVIKNNNLTDKFPRLFEYVANRDSILLNYQTKYKLSRDTIKQLFTMIGFGGSYKTWSVTRNISFEDDSFIQELNQEYYELSSIVYDKNPHIINDVIKSNPTKFVSYTDEFSLLSAKKRCVMAMFYQTIERYCQEACITFLVNNKWFNMKHIVPCQDGFMILKELYYPELCNDCEMVVKNKFDFNLKFTVKEFDESYPIPAFVSEKELQKLKREELKALRKKHLEDERALKKQERDNAEYMKTQLQDEKIDKKEDLLSELEQEKVDRFTEFEKNHIKIINKAVYIVELPDRTIVKTKKQLMETYEHLEGIKKLTHMGITTVPFITAWTTMNSNIRSKDDMNIYPPPIRCPNNTYNLWRGFDGELYPELYTPNIEALNIIKHHILILCNHCTEVAHYVEMWIAQMIQYPAMKSNCPILISKQGAGKGTLLQFISQMIGKTKYHETTTPERDVWGSFNSIMSDCYLVNLNELSKAQTNDAMGVIKGLITDGALTINPKGVAQYKIDSFHRFIITTNKEDPIPTQHDDRRFFIIRSSDELIGNKAYFNNMYALLKDQDVKSTIFNYFKTLPDADRFSDLPIPKTEYQQNIQDGNMSIPEQWLRDYVLDKKNEQIELLPTQIFSLFENWKERNGVKYDMNSIKLGVQISNMNIPGILKGKHTNKGNTKIFNVKAIKKHFGIGCLVQFQEGEYAEDR
jgi:hypothetical protein